ncbi:hypothetical protein SISSUDRAFT_969589, partial [Sistotremastrum suecicum HHB10207 ss-3]
CVYLRLTGFVSFGFNTADTQLMTVPQVSLLLIIAINSILTLSSTIKALINSPFILFSLTLNIIGYSILLSNVKWSAHYLGIYSILAGGYSAFPIMISWASNNFAGHYKRCVSMALQIGLGNFGGARSSDVYRTQDAPRYKLGYGNISMFERFVIIATIVSILLYRHINAKRANLVAGDSKRGKEGVKLSREETRRLGDNAPTSRY